MKANSFLKRNIFVLCLWILFPLCSFASSTQSTSRPISDFINSQGSIKIPVGLLSLAAQSNYFDSKGKRVFIDRSGIYAKSFNNYGYSLIQPTFTGTIMETPLPNGQAEVIIHIVTHNAMIYVVDQSDGSKCNYLGVTIAAFCPTLFGYGMKDLLQDRNLTPVLTDSVYDIVLINSAPGAPIPDLVMTGTSSSSPAYVKSFSLEATAVGPLPDGRTGLVTFSEQQNGEGAGNVSITITPVTQVLQ